VEFLGEQVVGLLEGLVVALGHLYIDYLLLENLRMDREIKVINRICFYKDIQ
jgi:hypothetical protein